MLKKKRNNNKCRNTFNNSKINSEKNEKKIWNQEY